MSNNQADLGVLVHQLTTSPTSRLKLNNGELHATLDTNEPHNPTRGVRTGE